MKKLFLVFSMVLMTAPAFAQRYGTCQVVMIDRYNRVIQRFFAQTDYRTGMCREGLRQCNYEIQRRNLYGVRCATVR